jgi:hypothetical protein
MQWVPREPLQEMLLACITATHGWQARDTDPRAIWQMPLVERKIHLRWRAMLRVASRFPLDPASWIQVPVEPTARMVAAAVEATRGMQPNFIDHRQKIPARAMAKKKAALRWDAMVTAWQDDSV